MKVQLVKLTTIFTIMLIGCGQEKKEQPVTLKAEKSINPKVQEESSENHPATKYFDAALTRPKVSGSKSSKVFPSFKCCSFK